MKILSVRFKNINSLAGEWSIDFTEPQFADAGIFVITGKTGAGKSSILDAISLALYGKTPRVEITGQNNDVMTHGANDCFSEIVFEVNSNRWKSSWKQERTRNGTLKPVIRQIADRQNKIHADQIRACDGKIVEILGLDFPQFTKVVMLAQGSFAAFLQADKNEKGKLLEQITGTELYSEISKKVFERNRTEKANLDKILIELEAVKILPEEEIEKINSEIEEFEKQKQQFDNEIQFMETAKNWLKNLSDLQIQIHEAKAKLSELEHRVQATTTGLEQSEVNLKTAKTEQENAAPVLIQVRELDTKIAEKAKMLHPVLLAISQLENQQKALSQKHEKQKNDLTNAQKTLSEKQEWAKINAKYESLAGNYAALKNQHALVVALSHDFATKNKDLRTAEKELQTKSIQFQDTKIQFADKEKTFNEKTQEFETKKKELTTVLSGKETADYQKEKENIKTFGIQIKNLTDIEREMAKSAIEIEKNEKVVFSSLQSEKIKSGTISENKTTAENIDKQIVLLEENIRFAQTIQSLDEHRQSLQDGKECPLCGALEHPFAHGNEPKIGEKETELAHLKNQSKELTKTIQQDEKILAKLISDKEHSQNNKQKEEQNLSAHQVKQAEIFNEIQMLKPDFVIPNVENKISFLEKIREQKLNEYQKIDATLIQATEIEKWIKKLQNEEIPQLLQANQTTEKAKNDAETALKLSEQQVENKKFFFNEAEKKLRENEADFLQKLAGYGVDNFETLKKCLSDWNSNRQAMVDLKEQTVKLEHATTLTEQETSNHQQQINTKTGEKQNLENEQQTLSSERFSLFGEKLVENEEKRLKQLLENAETLKTNAQTEKTKADTELEKNKGIIAEKEKELTKKREQKMTDQTLEDLNAQLEEKKWQKDQFSQKIGAHHQTIKTNNEQLKSSSKKLKEKDRQQTVCGRWAKLNELIGSADGIKYRNFAQALTFEHLIGLANRQLQKMSERYVLKRVGDAGNPFELSVIDKFQNCDERTAQNLSGGEKFIVSLSLALGLANMASKNMKIDTMFIDEGFGTLDSDYLDVALSALSNLQNEGKLIGVISHLSELKERIATHIEVVPNSNGHSQVVVRK